MQIHPIESRLPPEPSRAELVARIQVLESLSHRRSLMMTAAGHDLRQPLQNILTAIEHVASPRSQPEAAFWHSVAMEQVSRLSHGLAELMMACSDEQPCFGDAHRPIAIASIFEWLDAEWSVAADDRHLYLRFVPSSAMVVSDPAILRAILTNLVGNAIKYTAEGGIVVGCRRSGDVLAVDVVDTGCGLDPALHPRIFDAFAQGQPSSEGFGMGLWLVQRLSRVSGHPLRFWSRPGSGSRFRVSVPIARIAAH